MTLDYELARQLKEAGFPQTIRWGKFVYSADGGLKVCTRKGAIAKDNEIDPATPELILTPTLEELIEACGDEQLKLERPVLGLWIAQTSSWKADGSTPIEAVAHLYLALHSPSQD